MAPATTASWSVTVTDLCGKDTTDLVTVTVAYDTVRVSIAPGTGICIGGTAGRARSPRLRPGPAPPAALRHPLQPPSQPPNRARPPMQTPHDMASNTTPPPDPPPHPATNAAQDQLTISDEAAQLEIPPLNSSRRQRGLGCKQKARLTRPQMPRVERLDLGIVSAGALVGATLLLSGVALMAIRSGSKALEHSSRKTARQMQLAGSLQTAFQQMRASGHASQIALVIELLEKDSKRVGECSSCHDSGMVDQHSKSFQESSSRVEGYLKDMAPLAVSEEEKAALRELGRQVRDWGSAYGSYLADSRSGDFERAHTTATDRIFPLIARVRRQLCIRYR